MHRLSTDAEWLKTGRVVVDEYRLGQALSRRLAPIENRASIQWLYYGTGTPTLSDFPGIKIGDRIMRVSDDQVWRVDE